MYRTAAIGLALAAAAQAQYSATYLPSNAPAQSEQGQAGTNKCSTTSDQNSTCQNAYINAVDDFCLWAPPNPGADSTIGETEREEVAWCLKSGYGTRLIPDGTLQGVHFVQTPDYVQITGVGDLTKINIPKGDAGGELDPHGADGNGNPIGGLVFSTAFGPLQQLHEWTNFMSDSQFCFRACKEGGNGPALCNHIYDVMGCEWNMPGNYDAGTFESCKSDSGEPMGVYGGSTFHQGDGNTPPPHPAPVSSMCTTSATLANGAAVAGAATNSVGTTSPTSPTSSSSSPPPPLPISTNADTNSPALTPQTTATTAPATTTPTSGSTSKTSGGAAATKSSSASAMDVPRVWTRGGLAAVVALVGAAVGAALV